MTSLGRRPLGHDLVIFGATTIAMQLVSAASTPIYTRALGPGEFGVLETAIAIVSLGMVLLSLGADQGVVVMVATRDASDTGPFVGTSLAWPALISVLASVGLFTLAPKSADRGVVTALALGMPFFVLVFVSQQALRAVDLPRPFVRSAAWRSVGSTIITCALVLTILPTASAVIIGLVVGSAIATLLNLRALGVAADLDVTRGATSALARFGLPLLPSAVATWSSTYIDRFMLASSASFAEVGYYGVATRIAGILTTIVIGIQTAWTPRAVRSSDDPAAYGSNQLTEGFLYLGGLVAVAGAALCAFGPEAVALLGGKEFRAAAVVLPVLIAAQAIFSLTVIFQVPALTQHRTGLLSLIAIIAAVINLAMNLVLIPRFNMWGAAVATLISTSVLTGSLARLSQLIAPTKYPVARLSAIWAAAMPLAMAGFLPLGWLSSGLKVLAVGLTVGILHWTRTLTVNGARSFLTSSLSSGVTEVS